MRGSSLDRLPERWPNATTAAGIAAAEQALYRAMIAQDFAALDAILADDAVYIHSTAVAESKQGYLDGVRDGLYQVRLDRQRRCVGSLLW